MLGNRAQILLNGDEIFPAMLAAIREAKTTITFANFLRALPRRRGRQRAPRRRRQQPHAEEAPEADGGRGLHAKTMVVDGQWVSIGSANLDNRSFALNNELNLAFLDKGLAARMTEIFGDDLKASQQVTYEDWQRHGWRNFFYLPLIPLRDQL